MVEWSVLWRLRSTARFCLAGRSPSGSDATPRRKRSPAHENDSGAFRAFLAFQVIGYKGRGEWVTWLPYALPTTPGSHKC